MKKTLLILTLASLLAFGQINLARLANRLPSDLSFAPAVAYDSGGEAVSVAVADVNGDGKADLLVANCGAFVMRPAALECSWEMVTALSSRL
jgi:hypothetical protein